MAFPHPGSGHQALRRGRWPEPGRIYLVTTTTYRREPHFSRWEVASRMSEVLACRSTWSPHAELLCWVLMPDHLHGLVRLTGTAPLAQVVGLAKGRSAHAPRNVLAGKRVWAGGFHDRALRRDDDTLVAARYIIANPMRAELVARVGDYPFWDAVWLE
ncbi:transposase [Pseudoxanthomonas sp. PXM03]|uniref:REP-associated tyrosine transposase n=1 Tax=Pseudoxanthomonas sp. PXM03 TaxID=2769284 RepID=UPI0017818BE6|nr:transposase [Pseudoxanthomonas sp. PXM03]MBD9436975.1 transposase [Pseudoxanthomonas sp. PXM03]